MADTAMVFNALTGPEMIKVILADIEKKLVATGEFDNNVTFPWVKYDYKVSMVVYPKQATDAAPGIVVESKGGSEGGVPGEAGADEIKTVEVEETVIVDTPDLARIASDLPIPTPAKGPGNVIIDKPVTPAKPDANRKPFGYKGTDGKGASGTGTNQ